MIVLNRVPVAWQGPSVVGTAVNVLHYAGTPTDAPPLAAIRTAYQGLAPFLPTGLSIVFPSSGDKIQDTDGMLSGTWTAAAPGPVVGSAPAATAAGVGACIGWTTGQVVNGRRVKGRTFIVPLATNAYDTDGTLVSGAMTVLTTLGTALIAAGMLEVWHRPTSPGGTDGLACGVTASRVKDKVAFLSSRRD